MWGVRHGHHMGAPVRFARHAVRIPIYLLWSWGPVHQLWATIPARYQCIRCRQHHNEGSCDLFLYPSDHFYSRTVVCVPSSMVELYRYAEFIWGGIQNFSSLRNPFQDTAARVIDLWQPRRFLGGKQAEDMTASKQALPAMELSQAQRVGDSGIEDYCIVVTTEASELVHSYCSYHSMAGPVRPDSVQNLHLAGDMVKWSWSENSFDKASAGAYFERQVTFEDGKLAWAGPVVRTPKVRARAVPPVSAGRPVRLEDMQVQPKWEHTYGDDKVAIHVTHAASGSVLVWDGTSTAENQSIDQLRTRVVNGLLHIEFVYRTSENGSRHVSNWDLFVKLGDSGLLEWAK